MDNVNTPNNPLLEEHNQIIAPYHPPSQPFINKYPPQYHNNINTEKTKEKNISEKIMTIIKQILQSNNILDYSLFNIIEENVMNAFHQHSI